MQNEDVRQFDTTGKWLQFVYCLPPFQCVILFSLGHNPANMRNISRPWPNLNSSKGSQDTSACQISVHNGHAFSIKYGNHTFEMFHWVKMPPKLVKWTDRDQNLTSWVDGTPTSEVNPVPIWYILTPHLGHQMVKITFDLENSNVKVMVKVKPIGHIWGLEFNRYFAFRFVAIGPLFVEI